MNNPVQTKSNKRSPLLWLIPTQLAAVFSAYAITAGEQVLRFALLGGLLWAMLAPLLVSLEAGLAAILIFEPFHGFLRRAQYIFVPYTSNEPIHLVAPIVTMFAFLMVLFRHKLEIVRLTPLAVPVSMFVAICFAQIFNPLQGGLYIGLTGALFYLLPVFWFYFGQSAKAEFLPKMLKLTVVLGLITSFYGVYQMTFGYPYFEQYWIDNTDLYGSMAIYNAQRALATFSNAEEWGRYLLIGIIVAAGFGMSRNEGKKRILWIAAAAVLCGMLALTGQRSSIFGIIVGLAILIFTSAKTLGGGALRVALISVPLLLVLLVAKPPDDDFGYDLDESDRMTAVLSHTAKGTVNPTGEGSLFVRFETWGKSVGEIAYNPFGHGLGAETLAAHREHKDKDLAIDNYFFSLALSAGIPGLLLVIWVLFRAFYFCWRGWREAVPHSAESDMWRIALALMSSFILNNFFGTSFLIYSVAPIGWLLVGWISANYAKPENIGETEETEEGFDYDFLDEKSLKRI